MAPTNKKVKAPPKNAAKKKAPNKKTPKKKATPVKANTAAKAGKSKTLQLKDLGKSGKFHQTVSRLIDHFHKQLSAAGFTQRLATVRFNAEENGLVCPCGVETVINPRTGEKETRCIQCPPPPPPPENP
jgi:hypothetical protein